MPEKKKTSGSKSADKPVTKAPASRPTKTPERSRTVVALEPPAAPPPTADRQLKAFEAAMRLFHEHKLAEARGRFLEAAEGPERDIANRARLRSAMCDRRMQAPAVSLSTPEDYYNYGVALMNARHLEEARRHLERALDLAPDADHVYYALALSQGLSGDLDGAYANLKRAIELEPRNRISARQDVDFAPLAHHPPLSALLYPEKKSW